MITALTELTLGIEAIEQAFAGSGSWQEYVQEGPQTILEKRIFSDTVLLDVSDDELSKLRPFVIIQEQDYTFDADSIGPEGGVSGLRSTSYSVLLTDNSIHPGAISNQLHREAKRQFLNWVGCLLIDIRKSAGQDNNWVFQSAATQGPAERMPDESRTADNDYWEQLVLFTSSEGSNG